MLKNSFLILIIGLFFITYRKSHVDLNLVELKTFENFEVATSSKENVALYKKEFIDSSGKMQEVYLTLGEMKDGKVVVREGLQKLHTNIFWDPNRCAQMLNIIGNGAIIFSDTFKNVEGDGYATKYFDRLQSRSGFAETIYQWTRFLRYFQTKKHLGTL